MKRKNNNSLPRMQKIICIAAGPIEFLQSDGTIATRTGDKCDLELYETYTTSGPVVSDDGELCYPLNEFGGEEMLAQRFVVYTNKRNAVSKFKNH
jgi:hypothetical protein